MAHRPRLLLSADADYMKNYVAALEQAGACPEGGYCPAPNLSYDGLVLCGGGDLDCALFGQENKGSDPPDLARDAAELALFRAFYEAGKPILGICRGMQLINVALGGDLIQDLPAHILPFHGRAARDLIHPIRTADGSLLHRLYGPTLRVNSFHHQAVDRLGAGLVATAWSEGGIVEAIEHQTAPVWAFQFHPERMSYGRHRDDADDAAAILSHFVAQCMR